MPNYLINFQEPTPSFYLTKDDIVHGQYDVLLRQVTCDFDKTGKFEETGTCSDNPDSTIDLLFGILYSQKESL